MKLFQVSSLSLLKKGGATHNGTHSAIDGNNETHDSVAQDTGDDCQFPAETDVDHGRSCTTKISAPPRSLDFTLKTCTSLSLDSTDEAPRGGLTNFPVRDRPGVGHPVGDIGAPVPGALGRRDGVEIGIGGSRRGGKAALLLTDLQAEARQQASPNARHVTCLGCVRLDGGSGWGAILLVVEQFVVVGCHSGI
jgi:hypothetical protein